MTFLADILAATFRNATPLVYGTVGETYTERSGVLNLGIEGTMYAGAFVGFAAAYQTGNALLGLAVAILVGIVAGGLMGLLTVTLGANQHVAGLGLTIALIGISEFANRLIFSGDTLARIEPMPLWDPLAGLGDIGTVANQYGLTYLAFLVVVPVAWWVLARTPLGLSIRAVGENPEAADVAGISVFRIRYVALMIGGALMAVGGAFITLVAAGHLHPGHHRGARLGLHRPRHLRALAHLPRRARGARLRGCLLAGPAPAHHARVRARAPRAHAGAAVRGGHRRPGPVRPQRALPGRLPEAVPSRLTPDDAAAPSGQQSTKTPPARASRREHGRPGLHEDRHRRGRHGPLGGRRAGGRGARRRRQGPGLGPQPARAAGQRHPPRRDRLPRERRAAARVGLRRATMYTTLSPCDMCTGAILLYKIPRVVIGENETFFGGEDYLRSRGVEVVVLDEPSASALMAEFIARYPDIWNEDIGEE